MTRYEILKEFGFSPAKAAEIELDCSRNDKYALTWLDMARKAILRKRREKSCP